VPEESNVVASTSLQRPLNQVDKANESSAVKSENGIYSRKNKPVSYLNVGSLPASIYSVREVIPSSLNMYYIYCFTFFILTLTIYLIKIIKL
jgi:hypothetical protein